MIPSTSRQSDFALSLARLGMLSVRAGETASARDAFGKNLEINQKLAHDDPTDATTQGNLAKSYLNLGDVNRALGNPSAARDAYQKASKSTSGWPATIPGMPTSKAAWRLRTSAWGTSTCSSTMSRPPGMATAMDWKSIKSGARRPAER